MHRHPPESAPNATHPPVTPMRDLLRLALDGLLCPVESRLESVLDRIEVRP